MKDKNKGGGEDRKIGEKERGKGGDEEEKEE